MHFVMCLIYSKLFYLFIDASFIVVVGCEFAQPKHRGTLGLISDLTYGLAYILTGLIFYLNPNWRSFQLYITLFHVFYLVYAL